jgi:hypothetical protein
MGKNTHSRHSFVIYDHVALLSVREIAATKAYAIGRRSVDACKSFPGLRLYRGVAKTPIPTSPRFANGCLPRVSIDSGVAPVKPNFQNSSRIVPGRHPLNRGRADEGAVLL